MEKAIINLEGIRTYDARNRTNLVTIDNMLTPGLSDVPTWNSNDFDQLVDRIRQARKKDRPVIMSMGAHVVKCGLSRYIIALMKEGFVTHIAGNGAFSIHDFELAYLGGTSENVPTAIEDGSFGMWEQTGRWMNEAIIEGAKQGLGYGMSLAVAMDKDENRFPYREDSIVYWAYKLGIPATFHVTIGTDIIHQHPSVDYAAIGQTSGKDFIKMCDSVSKMDEGVYMNFGSAVTGPEIFLKSLSISRNLGYQAYHIATANFDLLDLGNYRETVSQSQYDYYYRPRKNIVNRPTSLGGVGWHFCINHKVSIPNLYDRLLEK